jgi:hypothetical protein
VKAGKGGFFNDYLSGQKKQIPTSDTADFMHHPEYTAKDILGYEQLAEPKTRQQIQPAQSVIQMEVTLEVKPHIFIEVRVKNKTQKLKI